MVLRRIQSLRDRGSGGWQKGNGGHNRKEDGVGCRGYALEKKGQKFY